MKRFFCSLLAMIMLFGLVPLSAAPAVAAEKSYDGRELMYVDLGSVEWWRNDAAISYLYFFGASGSAWAALNAVSPNESVYAATVPAGSWSHVILARLNPAKITDGVPVWSAVWNKTGDIPLDTACNYLTAFADQSAEAEWTQFDHLLHLQHTQPENPFSDVKQDSYYFHPLLWAVDNSITSGTSDNCFSPGKACSRAEIMTFLWRASGSPAPKNPTNRFTDVPAGKWYETPVLWAVENGITAGTSETTFSPNGQCTRAQVVTFLWQVNGRPASTQADCPFTDVKPDAYYYHAVLWAVENGITVGTSETTFSPKKSCTRAQIVTFLYKAKICDYRLQELKITADHADVTVSATYNCDLRIHLMTDERAEIFRSEKQPMAGGLRMEPVSLQLPSPLPDSFLLQAELIDFEGNQLCVLTSIHYTAAYEAFSRQTPEDFPDRIVLDFDDAGFAVVTEAAVELQGYAAEASDAYVVHSDDLPKPGDVIAVRLPDGTTVPIMVSEAVDIGDGEYSVTADSEAGVSDLYDVVKISDEIDLGSLIQAQDPAGALTADPKQTRRPDLLAEFSGEFSFGPAEVTVNGSWGLSVSFSYDRNHFGKGYYDCSVLTEIDSKLEFAVTGAVDSTEIKDSSGKPISPAIILYDGPPLLLGAPAYGYANLSLTVPLDYRFEGSTRLSAVISKYSGYTYNTLDKKLNPIGDYDTERFSAEVEGGLSATFGPKLSCTVTLLGLVEGEIYGKIGLSVDGKVKKTLFDTDSDHKHLCSLCVDFDADAFIELEASIGCKLEKWFPKLKVSLPLLKVSYPLGDAYYSKELGFDFGECPNEGWRTVLSVRDGYGNPITGGHLTVQNSDSVIESSGPAPLTDYCVNGSYQVSGTVTDKGKTVTLDPVDFTVAGKAQTVILYTEAVFLLHFDPTEGSGQMKEMTAPVVNGKTEMLLPVSSFERPANKRFKAWEIDGTEYQPGDTVMLTHDSTAKAVWEDNLLTVSFLPGEGTGTMDELNVLEGTRIYLPYPSFTAPKDTYFNAWSVNGKELQAGAGVTVTKNIVATALWEDGVMLTAEELFSWTDTNYGRYNLRAVITENNELWMWGKWTDISTTVFLNSLKPARVMENVKSVNFEDNATLSILQKDGSLWQWGSKDLFASGGSAHLQPEKLADGIREYYQVGDLRAYLKMDGSLWIWGKNSYGQIGNGAKSNIWTNEPYNTLNGVSRFSTDGSTCCALCSDGSFWVWGKPGPGKTIHPGSPDSTKPYCVMYNVVDYLQDTGSFISYYTVRKRDGSVWAWGGAEEDPVTGEDEYPKLILSSVVSFTSDHTGVKPSFAAIDKYGTLWVWGESKYGNLGVGKTDNGSTSNPSETFLPVTKLMENVKSVYLSELTGAAIQTDGSYWGWGQNGTTYNPNGGSSGITYRPQKLQDGVLSACYKGCGNMILSNGDLLRWGSEKRTLGNGYERNQVQRSPIFITDNVTFVHSSNGFVAVVKKDGSLWAWGAYCGDGSEKRLAPVKICSGS